MSPRPPYRCDDALREAIGRNIAAFADRRHDLNGLKPAAVAVTIIEHHGEGAVVLTRRSPRLNAHTGQWAMPGGRCDPTESSADTALRELREEVALTLDHSAVLGTLDDFTTRSGYVITPVVVWGGAGVSLRANPAEVASIHPFPFSELNREDAPILEQIPESDRPVLSMPFEDTRVSSPTAAMLYQFREVALHGRAIRVAHYEQPLFAWQ